MKQLLICLSIVSILSFTVNSQIRIDDVGDGWKNYIQKSIDLIQNVDSLKYQRLISTCNHIGYWNGTYSTIEDSTILISNRDARSGNIHNIAAALVHESMHLYIKQQKYTLSIIKEEITCYLYELDFLLRIPNVEPWLIQHIITQLEILNK